MKGIASLTCDNRDAAGGADNTVRPLTHSLEYTKERLVMQDTRVCSIEGCDRRVRARSWCNTHYTRWRVKGVIGGAIARQGVPDWDRFNAKVDKSAGPDGCHPWTGTRDPAGYGKFRTDHGQYAHRWILGHIRGEHLTPGEFACHHCDNPPCCNLRHLYVGDALSNVHDAIRRGRAVNHRAESRAAQTHCKRGHEFTPENTYRSKSGHRSCRTCHRERQRAYHDQKHHGKDRVVA